MVAQPSQPHYMTVDEWRELEQHSHDVKHEYIDGQVYAMAGGTLDHSEIGVNVVIALRSTLGSGPCRVYNSDAAARLSATRYTYPDATVTCGEHDHGRIREIKTPRVIVEVLSDTTEAYDRGEKFGYYRECPAVQEYVLVNTKRQLVEVYHRTNAFAIHTSSSEWDGKCISKEGWILHVYKPGDEVELTSIDVHFPLAVLYELTDVPEIVEIPNGEV